MFLSMTQLKIVTTKSFFKVNTKIQIYFIKLLPKIFDIIYCKKSNNNKTKTRNNYFKRNLIHYDCKMIIYECKIFSRILRKTNSFFN